jgi:endonuclease G
MWSSSALFDVYYYSNTSPQNSYFNSLTWHRLGSLVRKWVKKENTLYVVSGPILRGPMKTIGDSKIPVPEHFYKVVLKMSNPPQAIGFILPNVPTSENLKKFAVSVKEVETVTGLVFFPSLEADVAEKVKENMNLNSWAF